MYYFFFVLPLCAVLVLVSTAVLQWCTSVCFCWRNILVICFFVPCSSTTYTYKEPKILHNSSHFPIFFDAVLLLWRRISNSPYSSHVLFFFCLMLARIHGHISTLATLNCWSFCVYSSAMRVIRRILSQFFMSPCCQHHRRCSITRSRADAFYSSIEPRFWRTCAKNKLAVWYEIDGR